MTDLCTSIVAHKWSPDLACPPVVITSYSIHCTKLYDRYYLSNQLKPNLFIFINDPNDHLESNTPLLVI
ncbi:hypothetical protein FGO68_gene156 [Halteria grandinella]|uniref:Uncharacterized protein n=1 Tax=Halteria grandinella TaxID=5974 RepID=A0A8J8N9Q9_HALGN|nr:hypothetical protein FGO68_gene156 [Halteria grandinella]